MSLEWDGSPYQDQNPATAKAFHDALTANSSQMGVLTAAAYDFSGFKKIIDVGGGYGGLLPPSSNPTRASEVCSMTGLPSSPAPANKSTLPVSQSDVNS